MFNMKAVQPTQLNLESGFKFKCHPGVSCFTRCCSNIDIMLTPYDVLRLKRRLGISSEEFIEKYTIIRADKNSSHPYAYLKMTDSEGKLCPFLKVPEGCTIYADRPVSCRYYPIGQGTLKKRDDAGKIIHEEFYFFVKEPHCKGYDEPDEWTIATWKDDQEITLYDSMNREWKELLMRRNLPNQPALDEKKRLQFFMASYDLDKFRRFVLDSRFFDIFDVPAEEQKAVAESEEAMMKLGFKYLKFILGLEQTLAVKEQHLKKGKKQE
ncbi:MAG: YkgJ family cysteine cluster protein [Nitrospiraceae bacterium]|nr:YkgJ family cysteine cluster protein [Nitrospiraceae bacterium]